MTEYNEQVEDIVENIINKIGICSIIELLKVGKIYLVQRTFYKDNKLISTFNISLPLECLHDLPFIIKEKIEVGLEVEEPKKYEIEKGTQVVFLFNDIINILIILIERYNSSKEINRLEYVSEYKFIEKNFDLILNMLNSQDA